MAYDLPGLVGDDILCLNLDEGGDDWFSRALAERRVVLEFPKDLADLNRYLMYNSPPGL